MSLSSTAPSICDSDQSVSYEEDRDTMSKDHYKNEGLPYPAEICTSSLNCTKSENDIIRIERVTFHIMQPSRHGRNPEIKDVTTSTSVLKDRVLRSYNDCAVQFSYPRSMLGDRFTVRI